MVCLWSVLAIYRFRNTDLTDAKVLEKNWWVILGIVALTITMLKVKM
jgi:hypothetical protein